MTFEAEIQYLNIKMMNEIGRIDIATLILEQTIERTEQFREGFYSTKRIKDHMRSNIAMLYDTIYNAAEDPELVVIAIRLLLLNLENVHATIMTEIDRLDR